jgi:hypothetical protein
MRSLAVIDSRSGPLLANHTWQVVLIPQIFP